MFDDEIYKYTKVDDNQYLHPRSTSDSVNFFYAATSSKLQPFHKFLEILNLPDVDTVYDSPTLFDNQSSSSLHFSDSEASNGNTRHKNELAP